MHHIRELHWREDVIAKLLSKHDVSPEEVEEAVLHDERGLLTDGAPAGRDPEQTLYRYLGRTAAGRYLFVVMIYLGKGVAEPISARTMSEKAKRRYRSR